MVGNSRVEGLYIRMLIRHMPYSLFLYVIPTQFCITNVIQKRADHPPKDIIFETNHSIKPPTVTDWAQWGCVWQRRRTAFSLQDSCKQIVAPLN